MNIEYPVYVHKHLLNGRALNVGATHYTKRVTTSHRTRDQDDPKQSGSGIPWVQKLFLLEKLEQTKKTKHACFFLKPFDPVAARVPTYFDIIKQPMDLSTIKTKLTNDQYDRVQSLTDDIRLTVDNATSFFGPQHAVSHAGNYMFAYVRQFMSKLSSPDQTKAAAKISPGNMEVFTIGIDLKSHRALVLWSRWLYGRQM
jgi:hypothetical protein